MTFYEEEIPRFLKSFHDLNNCLFGLTSTGSKIIIFYLGTMKYVLSFTVETLYSTIYYSKYFIELNIDKSTQYVALWTHKRHPIPRPFGRAMECLLWVLQQKLIKGFYCMCFRQGKIMIAPVPVKQPWRIWLNRSNYRKISNIRRTKSPNLNVSRLVFQLSLPNPSKPGVKSRMKM